MSNEFDRPDVDTPALIDSATHGDRAALEALLARHLPALHAFVRLRAGGAAARKEASSDLVQTVCREVLQDLSGFEYRGEAAFRHWLFSRALHKIIDRNRYYARGRRDAAREVRLGTPSNPDAATLLELYQSFCTPSREVIAREEIERIERTIDALPEQYREVITLSRVVGLSSAQIAAQLGTTEAAVRGLLARGLARLARQLHGDRAPP